jgi:hypothetical protein
MLWYKNIFIALCWCKYSNDSKKEKSLNNFSRAYTANTPPQYKINRLEQSYRWSIFRAGRHYHVMNLKREERPYLFIFYSMRKVQSFKMKMLKILIFWYKNIM